MREPTAPTSYDRRVAHSLVDELRQPRVLEDGSGWEVYERWFTAEGLLDEVGGGDVLHTGHWFVAVHSPR